VANSRGNAKKRKRGNCVRTSATLPPRTKKRDVILREPPLLTRLKAVYGGERKDLDAGARANAGLPCPEASAVGFGA